MLSEMQQKFLKTVTDLQDIIKGCGDEKKQPSDHPPKAWFDKTSKDVKAGNPDYSDEQVRATVGSIWYKKIGGKKRAEIKKRGKSGVVKSIEDVIVSVMDAFGMDIQKGDARGMVDGDELEKGGKGEGSRGGKVIGHTSSGIAKYAPGLDRPDSPLDYYKHEGKHYADVGGKLYHVGSDWKPTKRAKGIKMGSKYGVKKSIQEDVNVESLIKSIDTLKEIFGSVEIEKSVAGDGEKIKSEPAYKTQTNDEFFKAIITEAKKEVAETPAESVVVDEAGKKLKPTDIRPSRVLKRYEDLLRSYREDLERNFEVAKLSIQDWIKNSYFYIGNCTKAEVDKITTMAEKAKGRVTAQVARSLIWNLEYAVRNGALDNNDPKMNQFKKELEAIIEKFNKKSGVKKSMSALDSALENLEKAVGSKGKVKKTENGDESEESEEEEEAEEKTSKKGGKKVIKKEKEEEEEEMDTEKSIKADTIYKALSLKHPIGTTYHIPNKGIGTIIKSEKGKLVVDIMGEENEVDFHKSLDANQNMFTDLYKSAEQQTGDDMIKSFHGADITKASQDADRLEKDRDRGLAQ